MKTIYIASITDLLNDPLYKTFEILTSNGYIATKLDGKFKTVLSHYVKEHINKIRNDNFNIKVVIILDCNPLNNWRNTSNESYYSNFNIMNNYLDNKLDSVVLERVCVDVVKQTVKSFENESIKCIKFNNVSSCDVKEYITSKISASFILFETTDIHIIENNNIFVHDNRQIPEYIKGKLEYKLHKEKVI